MLSNLVRELQSDPAAWERCKRLFTVRSIPAKTTLLREGEVARTMYFVKTGCLRLWFNKDGKDVTFQFFLEEQPVSSLESFLLGEPSLLSLESIEPTTVAALGRREWDTLYDIFPNLCGNSRQSGGPTFRAACAAHLAATVTAVPVSALNDLNGRP